MIEGAALPSPGTTLVLRRAEIEIGAVVIWSRAGRCGLRSEGHAHVDEWIAGRRLPEKSEPLVGQKRVDAIQAAVRQGHSLEEFRGANDESAIPSPSTDETDLEKRIFEELAAIKRTPDATTGALGDDPLVIARHPSRLQSLQSAADLLGHLIDVLRASGPSAEAEAIPIQALRARLLGKRMF